MPTNQLSQVIAQLRRTALLRDGQAMTDGQLLGCFIDRRDEAAFEALVRRHGPMVLGVCRRVLGNVHDAEDAFQATFLILVRKAKRVASREKIGGWLHGVAYHAAMKAKTKLARGRAREREVAQMPAKADASETLWHELQPLLD